MQSPLIEWTEKGLYCSAGKFYVDPQRVVETAVVTHAHSDHARRGCQRYYCTETGLPLLKSRLGKSIDAHALPFGKEIFIGKVKVSLHPAGHILGSAQVRIEFENDVWVISGDYKREPDPSCEPFEIVKCNTFITEATFGTPKYQWPKNSNHGKEIYDWWKANSARGMNSILFGYSLGKAQRILAELHPYADRPILIHKTISELTQCYRNEGIPLAPTLSLETHLESGPIKEELILAPPSILKTELSSLGEYQTAFASGWIQENSLYHKTFYDHGFIMSDHADWNDLNRTIEETKAKRVFVLHRSHGALVRHLRKKGIDAHPIESLTRKRFFEMDSQNLSLF